ncbi:MAG: glutamate-cysteine ligase family protein, partial [Acidimicrobiia bacterium]
MPTSKATIDAAIAARHVMSSAFPVGTADLVGVELELLPVTADGGRPDHGLVAEVVAGFAPPGTGTVVSFEPGGQLELSSRPFPDLDTACSALAADIAGLSSALAGAGVGLVGLGLDPGPLPERVRRAPRYDAMEAYFDGLGPEGRVMMRATAGLQVNLDCGRGRDWPLLRWGLVHLLGPVLAASFANSPFAGGRPSGWKSSRLAIWWRLDPTRTAPAGAPGRPPDSWSRYALDAHVMCIRPAAGSGTAPGSRERFVPLSRPFSFRRWLSEGHELGFPGLDDLDYHLTTLFPPVRPRGWLELRMPDSLPDPWWRVPVAVATALLYDAQAAEMAAWGARHTTGLWVEAARAGLAHPGLASAARCCFRAAQEALARLGTDPVTQAVVADYAQRYVE